MKDLEEGSSEESFPELEREAQLPAPVKTLRRIVLTITNPVLAMKLVAKDPDWFVVPLMFVILALFSFLQPIVVMSKMEIPDKLVLYIPNATKKFTIGDLKSDAQKIYWSTNLMFYLILILLGIIILVVLSKIIFGSSEYKAIISGISYVSIIFIILGLVWIVVMLTVPSVKINYRTYGNDTYIVWPEGIRVAWSNNCSIYLSSNSKIILPNGTSTTLASYLSSSDANGSKIFWTDGTKIAFPNGTELLFYNQSNLIWKEGKVVRGIFKPKDNITYVFWVNGSRIIYFNETRLEPISIMMLFNEELNKNTPKPIGQFLNLVLPALTRIWQAILLVFLIKNVHNTKWFKAIAVVLIQQAALYLLFYI